VSERESRLPTICPACQSSLILTTAKVPDANSYWRCKACGEIWNQGRYQAAPPAPRPWR
jgi:predicted Zn finger-like uncharacterized protein